MAIHLASADVRTAAETRPWHRPEKYWGAINDATSSFSAPVVALGVEALAHNAYDLLRRANGTPIRVASKSIRVREVLDAVLALPGYRGVLAYTLDEACWLSESIEDVLVAYPSTNQAAIAALCGDDRAAQRVTIMIDSVEQLDLVDHVCPPSQRPSIRVCLDFDASWRSRLLGDIGALRSPVHEPAALRRLAERVLQRRGFQLVGVMSYESQIAGVGDQPIGKPATGAIMRRVQRVSARELAERRADAIARVRSIVNLEFVNGGGTGSIERTVAEEAVTEIAAGSGLFGPHLFDNYRAFTPAPAVAFALDVVRRPNVDTVTALGGGWIASGPAGTDRLPQPVWPAGLRYSGREGAGEVQTPLIGSAAQTLKIGDRVWMRHTKSGEPMERTTQVIPVRTVTADDLGHRIAPVAGDAMLTYRGEGKCFV